MPEAPPAPDELPFVEAAAKPDTFTVAYGVPVRLDVLANDAASFNEIASFTQPQFGVVSLINGSIWFDPVVGFAGNTTFTYTVRDLEGTTSTATVTVAVTPPNLSEVDNSIQIDLWDYTAEDRKTEEMSFADAGAAILDAIRALRIPSRLVLLSGAWVMLFSFIFARIVRPWKYAVVTNVDRESTATVAPRRDGKGAFNLRHDADLVWVSNKRIRRRGTWFRKVETPTGIGLIRDDQVTDMVNAYLGTDDAAASPRPPLA
ncbi:MAG: Ig-like domain-containing protein [Acidimicrobiales bacterium]